MKRLDILKGKRQGLTLTLIFAETLRTWINKIEVDSGTRSGVTTDHSQRMKKLEREVRELKRANEILKKAAAFFAVAELDRKPK